MKRHFLSYGVSLKYHGETFGCASHCRKREISEKHWRLSASFGVSVGPPADFVAGITLGAIQYYFCEEICQSFPLFSEVRGGRITEAANTQRAARFQAGLEMSVLMPLVSGFCCSSCQSSQKWQRKENYFTHGRGPARAAQPFLLLLVEKNMSGEWGKAEVKTQDTVIRSYSSTSLFYNEPYQRSTS